MEPAFYPHMTIGLCIGRGRFKFNQACEAVLPSKIGTLYDDIYLCLYFCHSISLIAMKNNKHKNKKEVFPLSSYSPRLLSSN